MEAARGIGGEEYGHQACDVLSAFGDQSTSDLESSLLVELRIYSVSIVRLQIK